MDRIKIKNLIAVIIACALALTVLFTLFACNRDDDTPLVADTSRENAKADFVSVVLSARDANWTADMTDDAVASTSNGGDYLTSLYWTEFVSDILYDSALQTAKIEKLNTVLAGENGKAVINSPKHNAGKFIPLLVEVGFTADDINDLVYEGLLEFINKTDAILDNCQKRLNAVKLLSQDAAARANLDGAISSVSASKTTYSAFGASKTELIDAVTDAENGIKTLTGFCYNVSLLFGGEEESDFITSISAGALESITVSETAIYFASILDSVSEMKSSLTNNELSAVENALQLLLNKTDGMAIASDAFSGVLKYARYAYSFVGLLPTACTFVEDAGEYLLVEDNGNYKALNNLISAYTDENYYTSSEVSGGVNEHKYNLAITASGALLAALGVDFEEENATTLAAQKSTSCESVKGLLNAYYNSIGDDYRKKAVLLYIDFALQRNEQTLSNEVYAKVTNLIGVEVMLNSFKSSYASYIAGDSTKINAMNSIIANTFIDGFGVTGISVTTSPTAGWYNNTVTAVKAKLNSVADECLTAAINDIKAHIDSFYEKEIDGLIDIAATELALANTAEFDALAAKLEASGIIELFEIKKENAPV